MRIHKVLAVVLGVLVIGEGIYLGFLSKKLSALERGEKRNEEQTYIQTTLPPNNKQGQKETTAQAVREESPLPGAKKNDTKNNQKKTRPHKISESRRSHKQLLPPGIATNRIIWKYCMKRPNI